MFYPLKLSVLGYIYALPSASCTTIVLVEIRMLTEKL